MSYQKADEIRVAVTHLVQGDVDRYVRELGNVTEDEPTKRAFNQMAWAIADLTAEIARLNGGEKTPAQVWSDEALWLREQQMWASGA